MNIEDDVKEAIAEFGDRAFERFVAKTVDITDNEHLLVLLEFNSTLTIKPPLILTT